MSVENHSSGPSGSQPQDAVLNEVLVNHREANLAAAGQPVEDPDLALAKMLQEQERAFMMVAGQDAAGGRFENVPPHGQESGEDDEDRVGLTDEELALRLQQEEQAEFEQRLLALAGVTPGEEDEEEEDMDSEGADPDNMSYEELTALGEVVGTVSTGLSKDQIAALPVKRYLEACTAADSSFECAHHEEEQCAVCRVEYEGEDDVTVLPCWHYYHVECIAQWLVQKKVCPQCNKEVVESQPHGGPMPLGERRGFQ